MGYVVVLHNQKGGTGKSTTATSLSALLGLLGRDVILIDSDPQANATDALGLKKRREKGGKGYAEYLQSKSNKTGRSVIKRRIQKAGQVGHIHVMGGSRENLIALEAQLQHPMVSLNTTTIADKLSALTETFDYVVVDTAPGVTHLTVGALQAADVVIAPVIPTQWSLEGVEQVHSTLKAVREEEVPVWPVLVMTSRNTATRNAKKFLEKHYPDDVFEQTVRRSGSVEGYEVKGKTLLQVRSTSPAAKDYIAWAQEFLTRMEES